MFIKFSSAGDANTPPSGGMGYGGAGGQVQDASIARIEFIFFCLEIGVEGFVVLLNVFTFSLLWFASKTEYKACFYIIMRTYTCFVTLNAIGTLVTLFNRKNTDFQECLWLQAIMVFNMFTCFASSIWLFYAGFNRMVVLCYPEKFTEAFGCWVVRCTMLVSAFIALAGSMMYQKMCAIYSMYDSETNTVMMVAADNSAEPFLVLAYIFPLFSLIFYAMAYNNLRKKRELVVSDKTRSIIDKAERKTLKIGMFIMVSYTIALGCHLLITKFLTNEDWMMVFNRIDDIVSTTPMIALPMALIGCNSKLMRMRKTSVSSTLTTETFSRNSSAKQKQSKASVASN